MKKRFAVWILVVFSILGIAAEVSLAKKQEKANVEKIYILGKKNS